MVIYQNQSQTWTTGATLSLVTVTGVDYFEPVGQGTTSGSGDELGSVTLPTF